MKSHNNSTEYTLSHLNNAPTVLPTNKNSVDIIIDEANKYFVAGYISNQAFQAKVNNNPEVRAKIHPDTLYWFPQYRDEYLPNLFANRITGTNFIASMGPQNRNAVAAFLKSTAFNDRLPIKTIISLGDTLGYEPLPNYCDFYDYASGEEKMSFYVDDLEHIYARSYRRLGSIAHADSVNQRNPRGIIQTRLDLTLFSIKDFKEIKKELYVTTYALHDNEAINLSDGEDDPNKKFEQPLDERKEILWQLFMKSLTEPVLIHCTGGVGRTGHLILTFELLKYHHEIYTLQNPKIIAQKILEILSRIRENRPGLVSTLGQFESAIKNAEILYHYALEKKYIQADLPVYESALEKPLENECVTRYSISV